MAEHRLSGQVGLLRSRQRRPQYWSAMSVVSSHYSLYSLERTNECFCLNQDARLWQDGRLM